MTIIWSYITLDFHIEHTLMILLLKYTDKPPKRQLIKNKDQIT